MNKCIKQLDSHSSHDDKSSGLSVHETCKEKKHKLLNLTNDSCIMFIKKYKINGYQYDYGYKFLIFEDDYNFVMSNYDQEILLKHLELIS